MHNSNQIGRAVYIYNNSWEENSYQQTRQGTLQNLSRDYFSFNSFYQFQDYQNQSQETKAVQMSQNQRYDISSGNYVANHSSMSPSRDPIYQVHLFLTQQQRNLMSIKNQRIPASSVQKVLYQLKDSVRDLSKNYQKLDKEIKKIKQDQERCFNEIQKIKVKQLEQDVYIQQRFQRIETKIEAYNNRLEPILNFISTLQNSARTSQTGLESERINRGNDWRGKVVRKKQNNILEQISAYSFRLFEEINQVQQNFGAWTGWKNSYQIFVYRVFSCLKNRQGLTENFLYVQKIFRCFIQILNENEYFTRKINNVNKNQFIQNTVDKILSIIERESHQNQIFNQNESFDQYFQFFFEYRIQPKTKFHNRLESVLLVFPQCQMIEQLTKEFKIQLNEEASHNVQKNLYMLMIGALTGRLREKNVDGKTMVLYSIIRSLELQYPRFLFTGKISYNNLVQKTGYQSNKVEILEKTYKIYSAL